MDWSGCIYSVVVWIQMQVVSLADSLRGLRGVRVNSLMMYAVQHQLPPSEKKLKTYLFAKAYPP